MPWSIESARFPFEPAGLAHCHCRDAFSGDLQIQIRGVADVQQVGSTYKITFWREGWGRGWGPPTNYERLGDQPGQKAKYWLIFKQIMRAAAPRFFCVCVGVSLVNNISARFFFRVAEFVVLWSCSATASGSRGAEAGER
jgi:hypothetical protein